MRVLHLTWEYPPVVHGGLGRYVDAVSRAQAAAGDDVRILAPADDLTDPNAAPARLHELRAGVGVTRVRLPAGTDFIDAMTQLQRQMTSAAAGFADVDVVHAHDWMVAEAARAVAEVAACPSVLTVHATEHGRRSGRLDDELHHRVHVAERRAIALADHVVVSSTAMRDEAVAHGAVAGLVHVVPAGVEADRWGVDDRTRRAARSRWCGTAEQLVVAAGRLEWEKGFSTLLRALPAVLRRQPSTRVVIAGQGSYEAVLRRLADDLGIAASLVLPGRLDAADLAQLFAAADVVVVPSRYEPFGLVALEAQAAGAAVVVTRTGGLADLVDDGVTGGVIDPGDVHRLADIVTDLLADPVLRQRLAQAGRASAAHRTWDDVARRLRAVYGSVAAH